MLLELRIKDFAIVDELTLALEPGLNALTGETGAGKSILIDALGAVLGDRASPAVVRAGAAKAVVEATFERPADLPPELELDEADDVVILSREIGAGGRGSARLNGRGVPLSLLQVAGRALVDIHGQSDHQSLLRPATHLFFLDRFGGLDGQRAQVADAVQRLRGVRQELARLQGDARELARRQDLLRFQVDEIDAAAASPGEDDELAARRTVLANAERLREAATAALAALDDERGAIDASLSAAKLLADAARLDSSLAEHAGQAEAAASQLQDLSRELRRWLDQLEADPDELQRLDDRLDALRSLKRKYGDTLDEVLAFAETARAELANILSADERIGQLQAEAERLRDGACAAAEQLSAARAKAAKRLAAAVEAELAELNMAGARFQAAVHRRSGEEAERWAGEDAPGRTGQDNVRRTGDEAQRRTGEEVHRRTGDQVQRRTGDDAQRRTGEEALQPTGLDDVTFLLAANPGEPPRPLAQVASGGEASRLMLALKSVFSAADETPVLVFDEIEAGVGARGGHVIGHKLRALAEHHQVLCITHLAPVAAMAGAHFRVRKLAAAGRTGTTVERLDGTARVEELAEMLAGSPIGEPARASARELLAAG